MNVWERPKSSLTNRRSKRNRRPKKVEFRNCKMMIGYSKPTKFDYRLISGMYVWVVPLTSPNGRIIVRRDWSGTGMGPKTIENLQSLGIWTVQDLMAAEENQVGFINGLHGISDAEYEAIMDRMNELL